MIVLYFYLNRFMITEFVILKQEGGKQCVENKERLTLRIHRGRSSQKPPALTSVLLAKHGGCPPGLGPALAGLGSRDIVTRLAETTVTSDLLSSSEAQTKPPSTPDCNLCRDGADQPLTGQLQQQQRVSSASSSSGEGGLRENVSNASQAYKVLYMETALCGCGPAANDASRKKSAANRAKRSAFEIFQAKNATKNGHKPRPLVSVSSKADRNR